MMKKNSPVASPPLMTKDDFVYSRLGMALVSAQRVEFITGKILEQLREFDEDVYRVTTSEFLEKSAKSKIAFNTLGGIFKILKLNPKLVIERELDDYLKKRNLFVHEYWRTFLISGSEEEVKHGIDFCYDFGKHSDSMESFFKGFLFFLALRHVKDRDQLEPSIKQWDADFEFFLTALKQGDLRHS